MFIAKTYIEAKYLAFKRRLYLFFYGKFDPYPKEYKYYKLSPSLITKHFLRSNKQKLNFENFQNHKNWKILARKKLIELLKIKKELHCKEISSTELKNNYGLKIIKKYIEFDKNRHAPIEIVTNNNTKKFKGIIICMQGTNSGAHLNIGKKLMPADVYKVYGGSSLAIQAAKLGYIAVSFERIGFGERMERHLANINSSPTIDTSMHFLLTGRTLLGETVNEIVSLAKWLSKTFNNSNIWLKGYSAAGTAAITAAAIDKKYIKGVAVGGCVGPFSETLLDRGTTGFNDIPEILQWFDMDALISLISPRPCIIVAGKEDHIWPYHLSKKVINKSNKVYALDNAKSNLLLIKGDKGHKYYPQLLWPVINTYFDKRNNNEK